MEYDQYLIPTVIEKNYIRRTRLRYLFPFAERTDNFYRRAD